MRSRINIVAKSIIIVYAITGCNTNPQLTDKGPPSFSKGLIAMERKDFSEASFHFAELAKEGNPASMNNLGVSLLMANRNEEAIYWFKKASRYGEPNAKMTLKAMGEDVPFSDLVGQHPTQLQRKVAEDIILITLSGIAVGVTAYYLSQGLSISPPRSTYYSKKTNRYADSIPIEKNDFADPSYNNVFRQYLVRGQGHTHSKFQSNYMNISNLKLDSQGENYPSIHGTAGSSYTNIGNFIFGSNGESYYRIGNTTLGSNGYSSTMIGNTTFNSNGSSSNQIGNFLFNSDGSYIHRIGNQTFGSDGIVCNRISISTFCN